MVKPNKWSRLPYVYLIRCEQNVETTWYNWPWKSEMKQITLRWEFRNEDARGNSKNLILIIWLHKRFGIELIKMQSKETIWL